jgi:hypothetical protein
VKRGLLLLNSIKNNRDFDAYSEITVAQTPMSDVSSLSNQNLLNSGPDKLSERTPVFDYKV